jgi:hypothetical protein
MSITLTLLSFARSVLGGLALLSPSLAAKALIIPYDSSASMAYRLFGSRELLCGCCLWLANTNSPELIRPVLTVSAIIDAIDILSTGLCVLQDGNLSPAAVTSIAGGAALFLSLQLWALSTLSEKGSRKAQ